MDTPTVAVTGATGFLGVHLVRELLHHHPTLTVLARAHPPAVLERIGRFLQLAAEPDLLAQLPDRIRVVRVDPAQPRLGLPHAQHQQLADELDTIWHCAADITLIGRLDQLRQVNVIGTQRILKLAQTGARRPLIHHISTAFVAGARRHGIIPEEPLDDTHGFENPYEHTKHQAETLVHTWATQHSRPAVIYRPSILVTNLPRCPALPRHPLRVVADLIERALSGLGQSSPAHARHVVRIPGDTTASTNLLQVDHAAMVMARLAEQQPPTAVDTYHIVHHHNTLITDLLAVLERAYPLQLHLVPKPPTDPTPLEAFLHNIPIAGAYARCHRRYDQTRTSAALDPPVAAPRITLDYLHAGIHRAPQA